MPWTCPACSAGRTDGPPTDGRCWNCGYDLRPDEKNGQNAAPIRRGKNARVHLAHADRLLRCLVCEHDRFDVGSAMIANAWLQVFDLEGWGRGGSHCICRQCRHVLYFADDQALRLAVADD